MTLSDILSERDSITSSVQVWSTWALSGDAVDYATSFFRLGVEFRLSRLGVLLLVF